MASSGRPECSHGWAITPRSEVLMLCVPFSKGNAVAVGRSAFYRFARAGQREVGESTLAEALDTAIRRDSSAHVIDVGVSAAGWG